MTDPAPPTFTGPDGGEYRYADPEEAPLMDDVDSTEVPAPDGAPVDEHPTLAPDAESTPPAAPAPAAEPAEETP